MKKYIKSEVAKKEERRRKKKLDKTGGALRPIVANTAMGRGGGRHKIEVTSKPKGAITTALEAKNRAKAKGETTSAAVLVSLDVHLMSPQSRAFANLRAGGFGVPKLQQLALPSTVGAREAIKPVNRVGFKAAEGGGITGGDTNDVVRGLHLETRSPSGAAPRGLNDAAFQLASLTRPKASSPKSPKAKTKTRRQSLGLGDRLLGLCFVSLLMLLLSRVFS